MLQLCEIIQTTFPRATVIFLLLYTGLVICFKVDNINIAVRAVITSVLISFSVYAYFQVIKTGAGSPADYEILHLKSLEAAERGTEFPPEILTKNSITLQNNGRYRYCSSCLVWKPDRCHHCSSCNKCFLKRDHHCPWFASCIGYNNQKIFLQFLIYVTLYSAWGFVASGSHLLGWFKNNHYENEYLDLQLLLVWLLSVGIFISITAFTSFTVYQITINQTTNERFKLERQQRDFEIYNSSLNRRSTMLKNPFDLGSCKANWATVMGNTWWKWLLPVGVQRSNESGDPWEGKGLFFKVNANVNDSLQESMLLQDQLMKRVTRRRASSDVKAPILTPTLDDLV
ncbi:HEL191Cp [Eremothecium sinecaudum]|uniref:Palmitoyltransferase n=1 Tax=Eremothecium sinecaudum TaxID=45286 RepID=A0A120K2C2_9SACH|nr:HEL191Cp [Eremothecium sinecaudum]AMD21090.1 HEL191Cp [Eremothecium sinecaudum]